MRNLIRIIIAGSFIAFLGSCKKDNNNLKSDNIVGKWQETKLTLHEATGATTSRDTTFTGSYFTALDYFQFNANGTATISKSGTFSFEGKATVELANKIFDYVGHYSYKFKDTLITMTQTDVIPTALGGGNNPIIRIESVIQLDADHLVMHIDMIPQSASTYPPALITTAYFTKEK